MLQQVLNLDRSSLQRVVCNCGREFAFPSTSLACSILQPVQDDLYDDLRVITPNDFELLAGKVKSADLMSYIVSNLKSDRWSHSQQYIRPRDELGCQHRKLV